MLDAGLRSMIQAAVETTLAPLPVVAVTLIEGEDYDSNAVIFVTIALPADAGQIPGDHLLRTMTAVNEALLRSGDQRMPYFLTTREGEAEPVDDDADAVS